MRQRREPVREERGVLAPSCHDHVRHGQRAPVLDHGAARRGGAPVPAFARVLARVLAALALAALAALAAAVVFAVLVAIAV